MKVVVDCNIFISAILLEDEYTKKVLEFCLKKELLSQMGPKLFCEYEDVLSRDKIISQVKIDRGEIEDLLNAFMSVSSWNEMYYLWLPNLKDEGDNHLVELAVASNADILITHNKKDFLQNELQFDFEILNAKEVCERIKP